MVRDELEDNTPEQNTIDNDLYFKDSDIEKAIANTAYKYNTMPPLGVDVIRPNQLPADTTTFLCGVCAVLYKRAANRLSRNIMSWSTGGVQVDLEKQRYALFQQLRADYEADFKAQATDRKAAINRAAGWGVV